MYLHKTANTFCSQTSEDIGPVAT